MTSFVAYVRSFKNEGHAIVLACDEADLMRLMQNFKQLRIDGEDDVFVIGDGNLTASDGKCLIEVRCSDISGARVERKGWDLFVWTVPQQQLPTYAEKISALLYGAQSGHQYLDAGDSSSPTVIVTRGEYTAEALRAMRE